MIEPIITEIKKTILATLLACVFVGASAQAHDLSNNSNCKLHKPGYFFNAEKNPCPACEKKDAIEKEARAAENKRREEAAVAKAKAEKEARDKAWRDKLAEDAKREKSNSLIITLPENNGVQMQKTEIRKGNTVFSSERDNSKSKLYSKTELIDNQYWSIITNESGGTVLKSTDFAVSGLNWTDYWWDIYLNEKIKEVPVNVIKIRENNGKFNLINSKGEKLLSEEDITGIVYCGNNFFMYFIGNEGILNQYRFRGDKMILYDYELNIKYVYDDKNPAGSCNLGKSVQVGRVSEFSIGTGLFAFTLETCTHQFAENNFYVIGDNKHIAVGQDRKPFQLGTTHTNWWKKSCKGE